MILSVPYSRGDNVIFDILTCGVEPYRSEVRLLIRRLSRAKRVGGKRPLARS